MGKVAREPLDPRDFRALPEPLDLEDTVTSQDSVVQPPEPDDELRDVQWVARTAGL